MKNISKIRMIVLLCVLMPTLLYAQWYPVNSNTTENLNDIFFVDSLTGYCSGGGDEYGFPEGKGVILKTTDGGENWTTIFTQDSLAIQHIAIVEENNYTKLYGFTLKNGASYLVSTFLSSQFQNWTVEPVSYRAKDVQVYDNVIYFMDDTNQNLEKIQNNVVSNILSNISIFQVNENRITYLNSTVDSVFISTVDGNSVEFSEVLPQEMSQNQITNARIASFGNTIIVKATYPGLVTITNTQSTDWTTHYLAPGLISDIVTSQIIYGMDNLNRIQVTINSGESWQVQDSLPVKIRAVYFYNQNLGFVVGENGTIYKTTNGGGVTRLNDVQPFKNRIEIYPNPSNKIVFFDIPNDLKIKHIYLSTSSGQKIKILMPDQRELSLSNLAYGVYFLTFETTEGVYTEKILVGK